MSRERKRVSRWCLELLCEETHDVAEELGLGLKAHDEGDEHSTGDVRDHEDELHACILEESETWQDVISKQKSKKLKEVRLSLLSVKDGPVHKSRKKHRCQGQMGEDQSDQGYWSCCLCRAGNAVSQSENRGNWCAQTFFCKGRAKQRRGGEDDSFQNM